MGLVHSIIYFFLFTSLSVGCLLAWILTGGGGEQTERSGVVLFFVMGFAHWRLLGGEDRGPMQVVPGLDVQAWFRFAGNFFFSKKNSSSCFMASSERLRVG